MLPSSPLPPLYSKWIVNVIPGPLPDETRATCSDCAMCSESEAVPFDARTKCCTYVPSIPNFLAGRILEDKIAVFESNLNFAQVRPQGVWPNEKFTKEYHPASPLFGRNLDWRCPYYLHEQGGLCGIWQQRNARCATWFCKHLRGEISREFWTAVETLMTAVEKSLSHWCIQELQCGTSEFREIFPTAIGDPPFSTWLKQQSFYANSASPEWMWEKWLGREQHFFVECAQKVEPLTWTDISEICGPGIEPLLYRVLDAYSKLQETSFPLTIRIAEFEQAEVDADRVRIWNGNPYDAITLPRRTLRLLHRLSGKNIEAAKPFVTDAVLQQMVHAKILI